MAFTKRNVKDRVVQYPRRYRLVPVTGQEDTYDLSPVTGTVTEPGTPINKAYLQPIEDAISGIESGVTTVPKATNADTVGGHRESHFVRTRDYGTIDLNNPAYPYPYITDIDNGTPIGLDANWYHIIYMAHRNTNGYGSQIAVCFYSYTKKICFRSSDGMTWGPWTPLASENHASPNGTYGLGLQTHYGHVALQASLTQANYQDGLALSGHLGKELNDKILTNKPVLLATVPLNTSATDIQNYLNNGGNPYDAYILQLEGSITITNSDTSSYGYCTIGLYDSASASIERIRLGGSMVTKSSSRTVSYSSLQYIFNISSTSYDVDSNNNYIDTFRYYSLDNTTYYIQAILNGTISTSAGARYFKIVPMNSKFTFSNNSMVLKIYGVNYNILS